MAMSREERLKRKRECEQRRRERDRDAHNAKKRAYREANKDHVNAKHREWLANNPDKAREYKQRDYENNRETYEAARARAKENKPLYHLWRAMLQRCFNETNHKYARYGARGVSVCARWADRETGYDSFVEDMGPRPEGYSLDRINNEGNYEPENCRWADHKTQAQNRKSCVATEDDIREAAALYAQGGVTWRQLADQFGYADASTLHRRCKNLNKE